MRPGGDATRRRIDSAVTLLPQPLSPDERDRRRARHVERHVVDGAQGARVRAEARHQVAHAQERRVAASPRTY